ncbi:helix-turn-helix domain-containing protein [Christensenellaceae bacterium OttesenSCG-928-L17]|nr:helix-turn-helix domain-containing protein [Christensenellaceae bacterium OttesenSCG-928-L17]
MNRLRELRMQSGYTQEMLGGYLGVQKAAICKYETGRANIPQELLTRLAALFSVSIDFLLGYSDALLPVSSDSYVSVPLVGSVHAGLPILANENIEDQIPVLKQDVRGGDYFFMEVVGDCMTDAHIIEGSLVLVRMQSRVENGEIAVVRIDDEVVLRRVKWLKNQLILYPANPAYEPMIIASGDVQIIGRVVEARIRGL